MKADRNKTIDMTVEEGKEYLERCITVSEKVSIDTVIDRTMPPCKTGHFQTKRS